MKRYILLAAMAAVAAVSCKPQPIPVEASLDAKPRSLEFAAASAPAQIVTVTAEETDWEYSQSDNSEWVTLKREGDALSVSVADNSTEVVRTAYVTITATVPDVLPVKVTIRQAAKSGEGSPEKPTISAAPETLTFAGESAPEQEVTVTVTGDITWKASPSGAEEWIHITSAEGKFTVRVDDNPKSLQRSASINVSPSDKTIPAVRVRVIQEPLEVEPSIVPILPDGATPEEGLLLPYSPGSVLFALSVEPEDAQWTAKVEGANTVWLSLNPVVAPGNNQLFVEYKLNETEEARTAEIVLTHSDPACEPVRVKVTQKAQPDMESTLLKDVHSEAMTQNRVEVQANNDWRDWPYSHWTFTLYSEGVTYNPTWARWGGSGERIRLLLTASPQQEDNLVVEERTYEVVSYDEYNVMPITERKPGWVSGSRGSGDTFYPSGTWYQIVEDGKITDRANAVSGTVTISRNGDDYTITWDLVSDAEFKVTGSYTGPLNIM